jgi:hypothetical protein
MVSYLSDWALSFVRVIGSTVVGEHSAVLWGGEGAVGDVDDPLGEGPGEKFIDKEQYTGPVVWRPRPPADVGGKQVGAEGIAVRKGGGLIPLVARDLRLQRTLPPKVGTTGLSSYGGGFLSFDDNAAEESVMTLYVPYAFVDGVPTKAHAIIVDPTDGNESISITHGEGYQLSLTKEDGLVALLDADTFLRAKPGEFTLQAPKIMLKGNVYLGASAETGIPLLAGPASPPSPSVFVSPL